MHFGAEWSDFDYIDEIHRLLDAADAVVTFNGDHFDLPTLNKDFLIEGQGPPEPYQSIDLYKVVKRKFKFPSNKLTYVTDRLGLGGKVPHEGHTLWVKVMAGDEKARKTMEKYNKGDVILTEKLYDKVLPWIPNHPNRLLFAGDACVRCSSGVLTKRGFYYTASAAYQTYRCSSCGGYQRDTGRTDGSTTRGM